MDTFNHYAAVQRQKAVSAYFTSTLLCLFTKQGPYSRTSYDISQVSDWSRWPSRPIRSLRYIVTCTRIRLLILDFAEQYRPTRPIVTRIMSRGDGGCFKHPGNTWAHTEPIYSAVHREQAQLCFNAFPLSEMLEQHLNSIDSVAWNTFLLRLMQYFSEVTLGHNKGYLEVLHQPVKGHLFEIT